MCIFKQPSGGRSGAERERNIKQLQIRQDYLITWAAARKSLFGG